MLAKDRHRINILKYLGNPDNDFVNRRTLAENVCGIGQRTLNKHFTPDELNDIEAEGLVLRRKKYQSGIAKADKALLKKAESGDVPAIKLLYQRFEDWSEKQRVEKTDKTLEDFLKEIHKNK